MLASSRTPRGTANALGGINPAPTNRFYASGQTGTAVTTRATVGRDALIPPHPRGGANTPGRDKSRPYDRRKARTNRETAPSAVSQTSVGADSISAREPRGGANTPGGHSRLRAAAARRLASQTRLRAPSIPPLRITFMYWPHRGRHNPPAGRRAGCPHPAAPRIAQTPAGGISGPRAAAARRLASETRLRAQ